MNYLVVNSVCCCLSLCCKQFWQSMYRIIGKQAFVKVAYCLIYYGSVILSVIMATFLDSSWSWVLNTFAPGIDCSNKQSKMEINCLSFAFVYRISLSLFIFSLAMLLILWICSARVALILNEGLFFSKFVIIMILFVIFLRIQNNIFMQFGQFSKIVSYIFVVCQQIILIDLCYLWGIKWAKKYSNGNQNYAILLISFTVLMFGGCIGFIVASFITHNPQIRWIDYLCCGQIAVMVIVQLLNWNKQNSLLATSALCLLVSYYMWSAGWSHPVLNNESPIGQQYNQPILYVNMVISMILLICSTAGSIYGSTNSQNLQNDFIDLDNQKPQREAEQEEHRSKQKQKWLQWLLFLTGMSCYVAMVFTDWGSADIVKLEFRLTFGAWTSKIVMASTIGVFYIWTLVAPRLCPNRNFYFQ